MEHYKIYADYLEHHGILGQKWGVRRFQNKDGTLTTAGKERYYGEGAGEINPKIKKYIGDDGRLSRKGEQVFSNYAGKLMTYKYLQDIKDGKYEHYEELRNDPKELNRLMKLVKKQINRAYDELNRKHKDIAKDIINSIDLEHYMPMSLNEIDEDEEIWSWSH